MTVMVQLMKGDVYRMDRIKASYIFSLLTFILFFMLVVFHLNSSSAQGVTPKYSGPVVIIEGDESHDTVRVYKHAFYGRVFIEHYSFGELVELYYNCPTEKLIVDLKGGPDVLYMEACDVDVIAFLGEGDDQAITLSGEDIIFGDAGADDIKSGDRDDYIFGGDGDDKINGLFGNDRLFGNGGNDKIYGEEGGDSIYGGDGDDELDGGYDVDRIYGGNGGDTIDGGSEKDYLYGEANDEINDNMDGGGGNDEMYGGGGKDIMNGRLGDDTLCGEGSDDLINGNDGNDIAGGGPGFDTINMGGQEYDVGAGETDGGGVGGCKDPPTSKSPSDCVAKFYIDGTGNCESSIPSPSPSPTP